MLILILMKSIGMMQKPSNHRLILERYYATKKPLPQCNMDFVSELNRIMILTNRCYNRIAKRYLGVQFQSTVLHVLIMLIIMMDRLKGYSEYAT